MSCLVILSGTVTLCPMELSLHTQWNYTVRILANAMHLVTIRHYIDIALIHSIDDVTSSPSLNQSLSRWFSEFV